VEIAITDNGIGLPQDRERIVEPYVTTREKGTGLGLAIVNKIVEEHGGEMTFARPRAEATRDHELCLRSAGRQAQFGSQRNEHCR
jgi:two-component system nitrogen regulation sensor histidine kinase NtrY